jgi:hypothetical protein
LQRFLRGAAGDEGAKGFEGLGREIVFGVGEEPGAVAVERVGEEGFGVATGDARGGFEERVAEDHREMRIAGRRCGEVRWKRV